MENKKIQNGGKKSPDDPVVSLSGSIVLFLVSCYLSILPASTAGYLFLKLFDPWAALEATGSWLVPVAIILAAVMLSLLVLYGWSWLQAKLSVGLVMGFKEIPEGKFKKSLYDKDFQQFSKRHLVKKFSIWLYKFHSPRWLYRKYAGTFIKIGKHVELPEWFPLEKCEIGDNTVIARQIVIGSHVIEGDYVTLKAVKIGKNCIIDADDEMHRTCVAPGAIIEDNVIVKPGTSIMKDTLLKEGGIYEENPVVHRIGEVSKLPDDEIDAWRKKVLAKNKLKSKMLDDWSSFTSRMPRLVNKAASLFGYAMGLGLIIAWWFGVVVALDTSFPLYGSIINIVLLPAIFFLAYGFNIFFPFVVTNHAVKKLRKSYPAICGPVDNNRAIEITDPAVIEKWKCYKWLQWQSVDRLMRSLFPDVMTFMYKYIGKGNDINLKSTFTEALVDPDHVSIGENTLFSVGTHVYAYSLTRGPNPRLVIKKTSIGKNCIIAPSNIMAGASIGDNVVLGIHSVVPEDARLEGNQVYAGNPAVDFKTFIAMKKQARQNLGITST
ncbi:MAG: hypothetical protein Q6373_009510 [Candidatus Sigynarchaeota archaeon]